MSSEELLQEFPLIVMSGRIIQEHDEWAAELPQQLAQKDTDFFLCDVVVEKKVVETQTAPLGTQGNSRDYGNPIPTPLAITDNGSAALGRPGADHQGRQQKAALIGKNYMGAQPRGVFFTRGQSFFFQRWMALSSRSKARPSGFCGDQLNRCRSLPAVL